MQTKCLRVICRSFVFGKLHSDPMKVQELHSYVILDKASQCHDYISRIMEADLPRGRWFMDHWIIQSVEGHNDVPALRYREVIHNNGRNTAASP